MNRRIARATAYLLVAPAIALPLGLAGCITPVDDAAMGPKAKTCGQTGWNRKGAGQAAMWMAVSNEGGWCASTLNGYDSRSNTTFPITLSVQAAPGHGRVAVAGAETSAPRFYYYPQPGYVGPDQFVMLTGARSDLSLTVMVNVTQ